MAKMSRLPPSLSRPLLDYMEGMTMAQTEVDELDRMVLPLLGNSAFVAQTFRARFNWKKNPLENPLENLSKSYNKKVKTPEEISS